MCTGRGALHQRHSHASRNDSCHTTTTTTPSIHHFPTDFSRLRPSFNQLPPTSSFRSTTKTTPLRIALYFIDPGARGGAMAKPTSLSDPSIPIGPAIHVVHISGRCFSQTLVWPTHATRVWVWEGGCRCGFHCERRDFASENETPDTAGRRWYAVASETRVTSEMNLHQKKEGIK